MLEEVTVKDIRDVLEAAGVKTRHVRKAIVDAVYDGRIAQKTRFSPVLKSGTETLEVFINSVLVGYNGSWDNVNESDLTEAAKKVYTSCKNNTV